MPHFQTQSFSSQEFFSWPIGCARMPFLSETFFVGFIAVEILVPSEVLPFPRFNLRFSLKFCGLPVPGFRSKE